MRLCSFVSRLSWTPWRQPRPVVAVVPLVGIIGRIGALRRGLTLADLARRLDDAFRLPHLKAVVVQVNSPGGAPVQAALIAKRIRALADEKSIPVIAMAEDVAASGGYWLLTAGDEIYADDSSLVGSIGVISAGFGFPDLLTRIGVERRVYTSGEHKGALDPFRPVVPEDVEHVRAIQADIHEAFREQVRTRRKGKLNAPEEELFSGRFWSGRAAVGLGLIDGIADTRTLMRERFGDKVRFVTMAGHRPWWRRRFGVVGGDAGTHGLHQAASALLDGVEERMLWSRFGL